MAGRFWGGKTRSGKRFAEAILSLMEHLPSFDYYLEPFVGGGGLLVQMAKRLPSDCPIIASDLDPKVITYLKAVKKGWVPPSKITKAQFDQLKATSRTQCTPMHFVVGHFTCFNGRYFADRFQNYTNPKLEVASRRIRKIAPFLKRVQFELRDYRDYTPKNTKNALIVCDPPYFAGDRYQYPDTFLQFDYPQFYQWVRDMSRENYVLFCDYDAPDGFLSIWKMPTTHNNKKRLSFQKVENLFIWDDESNAIVKRFK